MNPAELTAYRSLCQRWPECECQDLKWIDDVPFGETPILTGENFHRRTWEGKLLISDDQGDRLLIGHLESLLDEHAPAWSYGKLADESDGEPYCYSVDVTPTPPRYQECYGPSRLSALLAAVEAVMGAKGGVG